MNIQRILIANRGEIARRIIRTCLRMGIATIAVFEDEDHQSLFVKEADVAVRISSYLNTEEIVDIAVNMAADAVHPGNLSYHFYL